MDGLLLVDKPAGMTSHDVVGRIRKAAQQRRVGHTGTLDPAATGLLQICLGKATRLSEHLTGLPKTYTGTIRLGIETSSYDLDGEVIAENAVPELTLEQVQAACAAYVGDIQQIPPMVSAIKVGGQRLYKLARKGEVVERKPRNVTVHTLDILEMAGTELQFEVRCSSGTYIRSLAHDVGQDLGCGAALATLRRTEVGEQQVEQAIALDELDGPDSVEERLIPMGEILAFPSVVVNDKGLKAVTHGGVLEPSMVMEPVSGTSGWIQIKNDAGALLAIGEQQATGYIQPKRVFIES